jgi:hypothetical protein
VKSDQAVDVVPRPWGLSERSGSPYDS